MLSQLQAFGSYKSTFSQEPFTSRSKPKLIFKHPISFEAQKFQARSSSTRVASGIKIALEKIPNEQISDE